MSHYMYYSCCAWNYCIFENKQKKDDILSLSKTFLLLNMTKKLAKNNGVLFNS